MRVDTVRVQELGNKAPVHHQDLRTGTGSIKNVEINRERTEKLNCLSIQEEENTRLIYREKAILREAEYHNWSPKPSTSAGARPPPRHGGRRRPWGLHATGPNLMPTKNIPVPPACSEDKFTGHPVLVRVMQEKIVLHCMVTTDGLRKKLSALSMTKAKVGAEDLTVGKASKRGLSSS